MVKKVSFSVVLGTIIIIVIIAAARRIANVEPATTGTASSTNISSEIGQTLMIGISSTTLTAADASLIKTVHPGGIILFSRNIKTQAQTAKLIADLQMLDATYSSSSLFIAVDEEGGVVSRLPWISVKTGEPAITTTSSADQVATARAAALHTLGINVDLAPVLDAATKTDFLYNRTFEQPNEEVAGKLGAAMIQGYALGGILSAMKHFPGYVGISSDPEAKLYHVAVPDTEQFTIAAAANPAFVMVSNVVYPALDSSAPCPLSAQCIAYLHTKVPGSYLVISDDLADPVMRANYPIGASVVKAMQSGVDVQLVASGIPADTMAAYGAIVSGVKSGTISSQAIDVEYKKIIATKARL